MFTMYTNGMIDNVQRCLLATKDQLLSSYMPGIFGRASRNLTRKYPVR